MTVTATQNIYALVDFAIAKNTIPAEDRNYYINRLMEIMQMDAPEEIEYVAPEVPETATAYLEGLCSVAVESGILTDSGERRDLFSAKLMGALTPSPAEIRARFASISAEKGVAAATSDFYQLCRDVDYIRVDRVAKNARFFEDTEVGRLEITINLSKPEKDPRDIAAQRNAKQAGYPRCMLCVENPGYAGRIGFPARQNHRVIPLKLAGKEWFMQYSPYLYYSEHCIVFNGEHTPMKISRGTFERLSDFVDQFPHYMLGSNADLPIVGGSILSHDHFQGGNYHFPMDDAPVRIELKSSDSDIHAYIADWPMTCIVLETKDRAKLIDTADRILTAWRGYSDPSCGVLAETDAPHNTITPILRKNGDMYKLELVLRNNRTDSENPLGIYHPHADLHHIKKENIGLIEVMGLFILPGRLLAELTALQGYLTGERTLTRPEETDPLAKHYDWIAGIAAEVGTSLSVEEAEKAIHKALGAKCARVLQDAGVYKNTPEGNEGVLRFMRTVGFDA